MYEYKEFFNQEKVDLFLADLRSLFDRHNVGIISYRGEDGGDSDFYFNVDGSPVDTPTKSLFIDDWGMKEFEMNSVFMVNLTERSNVYHRDKLTILVCKS